MKPSTSFSVKAGGRWSRIGGAAFSLAMAAALVASRAAVARSTGSSPVQSVAADLLVLDYDNANALRFDETTGAFIDEFVTRRSGGLFEPQYAVFGPHDGHFYVSSGHFSGRPARFAVMRYDGATGDFIDVFTHGEPLHHTHGVVFGPDGNLYVGDLDQDNRGHFTGGQILRFDGTTGEFLDEFVPTGRGGLFHPFSIVFAPSIEDADALDLYVCDFRQANVVRFDGTTGEFRGVFVPKGSGGLSGPNGMTFGPDGNLYVSDSGISVSTDEAVSAILRYQGPAGSDPGAFMGTFVPPGTGGLRQSQAVLFGPDGNDDGYQDLYVPSSRLVGGNDKGDHGSVKRFDGVSGEFIDDFVPERSHGLNNAIGLTFRQTDPMTLAYRGGGSIRAGSSADRSADRAADRSVGAGIPSTVPARVESRGSGACQTDGYLLVADLDRHQVLRYDGSTGAFVDAFVPRKSGGLNQPWSVIVSAHDRNLYVSTGHYGGPGQIKAVLRFDGTTGAFIDEFVPRGLLTQIHSITFGPDGNLYVDDRIFVDGQRQGRVTRFDGITGEYLNDFVAFGSGGLGHPLAHVFGPGGKPGELDLYVSDEATRSVLRYDGDTGAFVDVFVARGSGDLQAPIGLTFGPDGNLYVADNALDGGNPAVLRFQGPAGTSPGAFIGAFVPSGSGGLLRPYGVLFGPDGNGDGRPDLYVANNEWTGAVKGKHGNVKRYDGVTGSFLDTFVPPDQDLLDAPWLMTFTDTDPATLAYTCSSSSR